MAVLKRGIVYVAMGEKARREAVKSATTAASLTGYPVRIISDEICPPFETIRVDNSGTRGRLEKTRLPYYSPFEFTLYLDADTRVMQPIDGGFEMLESGFDVVMTQSENQHQEAFWHVSEGEREMTMGVCLYEPVQWQAGVFFFANSPAVKTFFLVWQREWNCFKGNDQAAFVRALHLEPIKIWTLGRAWNGGAVIQHHFGRLS